MLGDSREVLLRHFVAGLPASFATAIERPWKEAIRLELENLIPPPTARSLTLEFTVPPRAGYANGADLDNLCEPVFSVLVNMLGWFGGRRPGIAAFQAQKAVGKPTGCSIAVMSSASLATQLGSRALLDAEAQGPLPHSARDSSFAAWAASSRLGTRHPGAPIGIALRFGEPTNLGDVATGRIKGVIDCLYPVIGGRVGAPDDSAVFLLEATRHDPAVNGSVHVRVVELDGKGVDDPRSGEGAELLGGSD